MKPILILSAALILCASARADDHDKLCAELARTERTFCAEVAKMGIADAFLANMADECFLPEHLGLTRDGYDRSIKEARARAGLAYKPGPNPDIQLIWEPSKVDVSNDGTLGYTWGRYDFTSKGKDGKPETSTGIYLTIWKRQSDGTWEVRIRRLAAAAGRFPRRSSVSSRGATCPGPRADRALLHRAHLDRVDRLFSDEDVRHDDHPVARLHPAAPQQVGERAADRLLGVGREPDEERLHAPHEQHVAGRPGGSSVNA